MQFITTDQRIAVENFEIGLIYTVTFTSGSYFLGACIGIGKDYVMFQRTAPELIFSLTMAAAADVAGIDPLGDDIGKIREYTGTVPATIKTDGSPLLDYLITGNTIQNGTPTPENPIMPQSCGELETSGEHSGQYKISILSNSTTMPVYLGEVQSTRRIKNLVLTGEEAWSLSNNRLMYTIKNTKAISYESMLCTHYIGVKSFIELYETTNSTAVTNRAVYINSGSTDIADFKSYLGAQYAAGTPVTVWYVLAEPEAGIVNEPLMRIGDYADTVSYRQSGVNIPTTDGLNIFDIDTTVKPSEVYLKYFSPLL